MSNDDADRRAPTGRALDALIAEKIFRYTLDYEFADMLFDGAPCVKELRDGNDEWGLLPAYSSDMNDAMLVVEQMHAGISPAEMGRYNFLTLVCTGHYGANWCASFDFGLSDDWFEADVLLSCPFAARADTAPLAICMAALAAVRAGGTENEELS